VETVNNTNSANEIESNSQDQAIEVITDFVAPKSKEDFSEGSTKIEHTYDNGSKVVFLLLTNGKVARIREGLGSDVEKASMESNGDRSAYLSSMMASTVTIDEKVVNMFELKAAKMKDYLNIQASFADLNF
jgi:hypothetical protein